MKKTPKVLIVEDERIAAEDIKRTLEHMGYSVIGIVSSSGDALRETERNKPDLILMDIKLKGEMDGVELSRCIRERFDIPIVYVTAIADKLTLQRAKVTEPFGYVHKPVDEKELFISVEMALFRSALEKELKRNEERYRIIFDGSRDAIFISAEDARFVEVNEAAAVLTGYSKEELLKMAIPDLHEGEDLHAYKKYFHRIMQGEQITS
ncbi:MAG: response regulator, partial [Candidatus Aminicenantales bacterium]